MEVEMSGKVGGNTRENKRENAEEANELIKSLFNLLSREKRRMIYLMCESVGKGENLRTLTKGCPTGLLTLYNLVTLSEKLEISHVTVRKLVREFVEEGLVEIREVGKSKIVLPTPKLCALCELLY